MGVLRVKVAGQWVDVGVSMPTFGRNLLDNGQMAVKQRTATSAAMGASTFLADRWSIGNSGLGAATLWYGTTSGFGQYPPAGRPRPGNVQYIQMTTAEAAGALAAGDYMVWQQSIEGQFLQHLNWGSADAQPLVLSVDVYSPIATTYVVEIYRGETTPRSISKLLTVPAGFSTQVLAFPGDTATAITNDAAGRLAVVFWLGAGSQRTSGTLQTAWGNTVDANRCPGVSNNFAATVGNAFVLTNAQLEVGTVPTPYEVRDNAQELLKAMRYYETTGYVLNTTVPPYYPGYWQVRKRALPVITHAPQGGTGAVFNAATGWGEGSMFYQNSNHTTASLTLVIGAADI